MLTELLFRSICLLAFLPSCLRRFPATVVPITERALLRTCMRSFWHCARVISCNGLMASLSVLSWCIDCYRLLGSVISPTSSSCCLLFSNRRPSKSHPHACLRCMERAVNMCSHDRHPGLWGGETTSRELGDPLWQGHI